MVQRKPFFTPAHCGVQDRFWVLAEGHSGNIRALVLKEWYSAQGKKNAVLCKKTRIIPRRKDYENNTVLFWWLKFEEFIFNSPVEAGFQVPAGGCIMSSAAQFLMNTKKVAATENVSGSRGTTEK